MSNEPLIRVIMSHKQTLSNSQYGNAWKFIQGRVIASDIAGTGPVPSGVRVGNEIAVAGMMPPIVPSNTKRRKIGGVPLSMIIERDPTPGTDRYHAIAVAGVWTVHDDSDSIDVKRALKQLGISEYKANMISQAYSGEFLNEIMREGNMAPLRALKGVGDKTIDNMRDAYDITSTGLLEVMNDLNPYGFELKEMRSIIRHFHSPMAVRQVIGDDFYSLAEVPSLTFNYVDKKYLTNHKATDSFRCAALTKHLFEQTRMKGSSWLSVNQIGRAFDVLINPLDDAKMTVVNSIVSGDNPDIMVIPGDVTKYAYREIAEVEMSIAYHLKRLTMAPAHPLDYIDEMIEKKTLQLGSPLSWEQQESVQAMMKSNTYLLQGYGGTGKTTSINVVTDVLRKNGLQVLAGAFTGKAAQNLTESVGFEATTLHAMLRAHGDNEFDTELIESADAIVIDELSMVPAPLFNTIVSNMKTGSRLYLIGDEGQLECINNVGVIRGIVESGIIPTQTLVDIQRRAKESANTLWSADVRNGVMPQELIDGQKNNWSDRYGILGDLRFDNATTVDNIINRTIAWSKAFYHKFPDESFNVVANIKRVTDPVNIALQENLNPYRFEIGKQVTFVSKYESIPYGAKGIVSDIVKNGTTSTIHIELDAGGSLMLDDKSTHIVQPSDDRGYSYRNSMNGVSSYHRGDRVLNTKNNYDVEPNVFNGTLGWVREVRTDDVGNIDSVIVDWDNIGEAVMPQDALRDIELGYGITVHKAQGSTIDNVVFAMAPVGGGFNSRELFYTGMTRVRKRQTIVSSLSVISDALNNKVLDKRQILLPDFALKHDSSLKQDSSLVMDDLEIDGLKLD